MSDTPRTDAAEFYSPHSSQKFCDAEFTRILERHLNSANDRIKRLEEAGDALASWTIPNGNSHVDWRKAKEVL